MDTQGERSVLLEPSGRANGLYFDEQGNLLACADAQGQIWSIAPDKTVTLLLRDFGGGSSMGQMTCGCSPKPVASAN